MFFMLHKVRNPRKGFAREYTLCSGRERGDREEGSCTYRGSPKQFLFLKIAAALPTWTRGGKSSSEACIQMREREGQKQDLNSAFIIFVNEKCIYNINLQKSSTKMTFKYTYIYIFFIYMYIYLECHIFLSLPQMLQEEM